LTHAPLPQAQLDDRQRIACLRLIRSENIGPVTFRELINRFGGATEAIDAIPELSRRSGRRRPFRLCPTADAERELEAAARIDAHPLFTIEPHYPALLAHLDAPPPLIYAKGNLALFARPTLAIVGSRDASAAGRQFTRQLAAALSAEGFVIASGLARGIDGEAHRASIAKGTIAVLAGGVDNIYPPEHADLHRSISETGILVSEQPPGFSPRGQDFPRRNRIISGLSYGVVVIEAAKHSGTLTTARFATEQGREVFAVPGHPLDPRAFGTNALIRSGANMVTCVEDVLTAIEPMLSDHASFRESFTPPPPKSSAAVHDDGLPHVVSKKMTETMPETSSPPQVADNERARVLAALGPMPVKIDELVRVTGLSVRAIQIALLDLDLAGRIERHSGQLVSAIDNR
jgi:DNA processing protein